MVIRLLTLSLVIFACSCSNDKKQSRGPIVLGDSSMIVTENNPKYLTNFVDDIQVIPVMKDTVATSPDIPSNDQPATQPSPSNNQAGLKVPFTGVTVFIPGIETRTFQNIDFAKASGASFQLTSGNLSGKQLRILSGNVIKVSQRYKTSVVVKNELGMLQLNGLNKLTDWKELKGRNNVYAISGLEEKNLEHADANTSQIRNYVIREAKNKRMSRATIQKWENSVKNVSSVTQDPLSVELRSVMWKIEGKDDKGKPFAKQVRIDVPIN